MKKIIIQFSVALLLITGIYVYKYNNEKDLEVSNISQDIMNDYEDIIIKHGNEDEKVIALTFDDGPDKDYTPQVLDILKKNNVPTFIFINKIDRVGADVNKVYQQLKRRFSEDICLLSNNSLMNLSDEEIEFIAGKDEELLNLYFEDNYNNQLWINKLKFLVKERQIFVASSGSALLDQGVREFLDIFNKLTMNTTIRVTYS